MSFASDVKNELCRVPPLEDGKRRSKRDRYQAYADRALEALDVYLATRPDLFGGDRS